LFPIILPIGHKVLDGKWLEPSISHYYYTGMIGVFVGTLFVVGIFLLTYRGYERVDDIATNIAGACAPLIALFPTTPSDPSQAEKIVGWLHFVFAAIFFLTIAWISFFLFTKSGRLPSSGSDQTITPAMLSPTYQQDELTPNKAKRNAVYRWCGLIMFGCVVLIGLCNALDVGKIWIWTPTFFFETIAIWAFGVSWLTKSKRFRWAQD